MENKTRYNIVGIVTRQDDLYGLTPEDGVLWVVPKRPKKLPFFAE